MVGSLRLTDLRRKSTRGGPEGKENGPVIESIQGLQCRTSSNLGLSGESRRKMSHCVLDCFRHFVYRACSMEFDIDGNGKILARTPQIIRNLLSGLPPELVQVNYGPQTWSPHEVIAHLIHGERTDWISRAKLILKSGDAVPFEPFDRNGHVALSQEKTTGELLDLFQMHRSASLTELRSMCLTATDLERRGQHPALGLVTLSQLLATWVVHDLNHIAQICKGIAFQHLDTVGPWKAYLSILSRPATALHATDGRPRQEMVQP
jgi:hypothetical protein